MSCYFLIFSYRANFENKNNIFQWFKLHQILAYFFSLRNWIAKKQKQLIFFIKKL